MVETSRFIWDARFLSDSIILSLAEVLFVLRFPNLSDEEKLLWLLIATKSARDPDLMCALSLEDMATNLGKSQDNICRSLLNLQAMGFVCGAEEITRGEPFIRDPIFEKRAFCLSLPNSGLLEIKMAIHEKVMSRHLFLKEDTEKLVKHKPKVIMNLLKEL